MAKTVALLLPSTNLLLQRFGERLRLARRRRRLSAKQVSARAGMAPMTLRSLERGGAGVTMGAYLAVMQVLGIEKDLDLLGAADPLGRELQDARLTAQGHSPARTNTPVSRTPAKQRPTITVADAARDRPLLDKLKKAKPRTRKRTATWAEASGFASAQTLVDLIDSRRTVPKNRR